MKKRLLSLLTAAAMFLMSIPFMAIPAAAETTYGFLLVSGIQVTPENKDDVLGDADEGATVTYDAGSQTLTLNGATITAVVAGIAYGIYSEVSELKIELVGNNTILPNAAAAQDPSGITVGGTTNTLEFTGTGSLNVTAGEASSNGISCGIDAKTLKISGGTITANGGKAGGYYGGYSAGIVASNLEISGGTVNATGGEGSDSYGIKGNLSISGNAIVNATGGTSNYSSYGIDGNLSISGNAIVNATGGSASNTSYGHNGALSMTGGAFTAKSTSTTGTAYAIYNALTNEQLANAAFTYLASADSSGSGAAGYVQADNGNYKYVQVKLITYDVTVGGTTVTAANKGDVLGDGTVSYDPNSNTLTLNGANFTSATDTAISVPANATITLVGSNIIKGADVSKTGGDESASAYGIYCDGDITINGSGSLDVTAGDAASTMGTAISYGIRVGYNNLMISGTAKVTAIGSECTSYSPASKGVYGNVTLDGGSLTAIGNTINGYGESSGIGGNVTVNAGILTATGEDFGVTGNATVTGGTLIASGSDRAIFLAITADGADIKTSTSTSAGTDEYVAENKGTYKWIKISFISTITASAGAGGTISPSGEVKVDGGTSKTFTITPNSGYSIASVTVDGENKGAISTYTFDDVSADHTISATFTANSSSPAVTTPPAVTPPADEKKTDWTEVGKQLENAKEGDTVTVDMNGGTSVPAETLESIKGKDIDLVLDMGDGMVWTINGKNITNAQNVDLGMKKNAMTIPVEVTNKITGETKMLQLSFEYDGELGFTATLTIELGDDVDGLFANLMLFNSETKTLEFVASAKISGGKTSLPFSHFSDWAIYVDSVDYATGVPNADAEQSTTAEEETGKGDNTSTGVSILPIALLTAISAAAIIVSKKRKQN